MIVDRLSFAKNYYGLGERIKTAFQYLETHDFSSMKKGEYPIRGKELYLIIARYLPRNKETALWEAHRKYIDIQYIVQGGDVMGYTPLDRVTVTQAYDAEIDALLGTGEGDFLNTSPGMFYLFDIQDAHMPGLAGNLPGNTEVIKAVVKVAVD